MGPVCKQAGWKLEPQTLGAATSPCTDPENDGNTRAPPCPASSAGKQLEFYVRYTVFCRHWWFSSRSLLSLQKKVCIKIKWIVYTTNCHILPCQILLGMPTQRQSLLPGKPSTPRSSSDHFSQAVFNQAACSKPTHFHILFLPQFGPTHSRWANSQPSTSPAPPPASLLLQ